METAGVDDPLRGIEGEIPALRRYARFLLRDPEAADDLVQDTLLRAVSRVHLWRPGNLRGWLFTIAHPVITDRYRGDHPEFPLETVAELHDGSASPED